MQVEKLEDICEIASGGTPKRSEDSYWKNGKIPWLKISDIKSKYVDKSEEHITQKGLDNSSAKLFKKGTIIYTIFATVGEVAILNIDATTNQAIAGLTIKDSAQINPSYLFYFLKSIKKQMHLLSRGVAQNNINLSVLRQIKVPIPDLNVQERIVNALDQMQNNIKLRQMELSKLDILIKARFVEMFGDPICNSKNKSTTKFINVVKLQRGFDLPIRKRNTQGKIPVYGSNGVLGYHDEFKASSGIITGRSGTIGKVYYENNEFWPLNTALFSVKTYGNNIIYLKYLVSLFKLERFCNGAGVPTLNRNEVHKQKIIDIPIKEQNKFASFVQQVDKSKVVNASIMKYIISIRFYLYFKENKEGAR